MFLCSESDCTGCGACYSVCPKHAITMCEDAKGFLSPVIDESVCVNCMACVKHCPILTCKSANEVPETVNACWHKDDDVRMKSSSGGAFSAIAEFVLSQGGFVWGAAYDEELKLKYQCIENISEIDKLRRSKYLQCEVGNTFLEIKKQLLQCRLVLFCGTSCHIRGLYEVVGKNDNLITIDFICHGVPSPKVFRKYIEWIQKKYNDRLISFNFRDKRYGWDNGVLTVGDFEHIGERVFMNSENSYFYGMLHDMFIRPCCHDCKCNGLTRMSDFTIADFWGIGRKLKFKEERQKLKGISMVALNTAKAKQILKKLNNIESVQRPINEAFEGNWNYRYSAPRNPQTASFWARFEKANEWDELLDMFIPTPTERVKLWVKKNMGPRISNILRKLMGR